MCMCLHVVFFFFPSVQDSFQFGNCLWKKEEFLSLCLIGLRGGRVEGVKEMFMMRVLVFFFLSFWWGKGFLFLKYCQACSVSVKHMQLLAIQSLAICGIVAKRSCCELVLCFADCFITKSRKDNVEGLGV